MRTVPPPREPSSVEPGTAASRGTRNIPSCTAIWGSPVARAADSRRIDSGWSSMSTSERRPGYSDCAVRSRPQTVAAGRSGEAAEAPRVTTARRPVPARCVCSNVSARTVSSCAVAAGSMCAPLRSDKDATTNSGASSDQDDSSSAEARNAARSRSSVVDIATAGTSPPAWTPVQRSRYSSPAGAGAISGAGRVVMDSSRATGSPVGVARSRVIESGPGVVMRTRRAVAPVACRVKPRQANGSRGASVGGSASSPACRAASSRAGWSMWRRASAIGNGPTSAKSSSPRRHSAVTPWNAGPYASPASATRS